MIERAQEFLTIFGLERHQNEIANNLPYGEQRRVEIARALASHPKLLLLDEPAAGMNPTEIGRLMELIHFIRDHFNLTILLIEHQMRLVMNICERLTVMDFGEVIVHRLPREIQDNPKVIEAYLGRGGGGTDGGRGELHEVKDLSLTTAPSTACRASPSPSTRRNRHPDRSRTAPASPPP